MLNTFLKQMEFLFALVAGFLFLSGHAFGAEATVSDKFAQVRGFKVEITGQTGKEVDTAWEAFNGGELTFDLLNGRLGFNWEAELSLTGGSGVEAEFLRKSLTRLQGSLRERDALLGTVREELAGAGEDLRELKDRPQPVAAPFLASPPAGSDKLGVAKGAVLAPRVEVESFLRHDTVVLKPRRVEATAVRTVAEVELTPDASGVDLPIDQSGALYLVEWSTAEGHVYNLVLRDGASGQLAASCPVKEKQNEGRFVLVGYRVD